ncbi:MAG TPA: hypothetical protein ENN55_01875, partial [Firmicutes bacterium]|nr:hypothetical protein [Bacillota bacterium]
MKEYLESVMFTFQGMRWNDIVDILFVAFVLYHLFLLLHETRAIQMLKGLAIILFFVVLSRLLDLHAMSWILTGLSAMWIIAFIIVFQPELRRVLVELGQNRIFGVLFKEHVQLY